MTHAPEDQNGLREALARCIDPDAWRVWDDWKDRPDGRMYVAAAIYRDKSLSKADALIAGPLASLIAERSAGYLFHNPDTGTEWSENHPVESGEVDDATDIRPATALVLKDEMIQAWDDAEILRRERDRAFALNAAAEAEITRLKEGMEALGAEAARFREDLTWIADQMPATCEMTVVHEMADRAHRALSPKEQP